MGHRARESSKSTAHLQSKCKNCICQVKEDDQKHHVQLEKETFLRTFDDCVLEDVEENKKDANTSTMSESTMVPASGLTREIMMMQCP